MSAAGKGNRAGRETSLPPAEYGPRHELTFPKNHPAVAELHSAAEDMLKFGEHGGECIKGDRLCPHCFGLLATGPCEKHGKTMQRRTERLQAAVEAL